MIILKSARPGGVVFRGVIGRGQGTARAALASVALRKSGAVKKSSVFEGVIGGSARREHARALVSAAGGVLLKSEAAVSVASRRAPFSISSALSKKNTGHAARAVGVSLSKAVNAGAAAAKRPSFRTGQRVVRRISEVERDLRARFRAGESVKVGGCVGTVVGNELRGGEPWVKVRMRGKVASHPEADVSPSKKK